MANKLKMHQSQLGNIVDWKIQHHLRKDCDMPNLRTAHKPLLTKQIVKKRIEYAKKDEYWTVEDWRKVFWSNEVQFFSMRERPSRIKEPRNLGKYFPPCTEKSVKYPEGVMVWDSFNGMGIGKGYNLIADNEVHGCEIFIHAGAPFHVATQRGLL